MSTVLFDIPPRHGVKAVSFGRWITLLRIWAGWLAGVTRIRWRSLLLWNALGRIAWAACFGLLGYFGGEAAARLVARVGVGTAIAIGVVLAAPWLVVHRRRAHR